MSSQCMWTQCWVTGRGLARKQGPGDILLPTLYFLLLYEREIEMLCTGDTYVVVGHSKPFGKLSTTGVGNCNTLINGMPA